MSLPSILGQVSYTKCVIEFARFLTSNQDFERRWVPGHNPPLGGEIGLKPLEFMEAHPRLKCLAWPMDHFFSASPRRDIAPRVQKVVDRLGWTLEDLRVDAEYKGSGEPHSEENAENIETGMTN